MMDPRAGSAHRPLSWHVLSLMRRGTRESALNSDRKKSKALYECCAHEASIQQQGSMNNTLPPISISLCLSLFLSDFLAVCV